MTAVTTDHLIRPHGGALEPRAAMYWRWFRPRSGSTETLHALRARGYPVGMISMCAPDAPAMWRASELAPLVDIAVFSCEVRLRKPHPEIYRAATDALGVVRGGPCTAATAPTASSRGRSRSG